MKLEDMKHILTKTAIFSLLFVSLFALKNHAQTEIESENFRTSPARLTLKGTPGTSNNSIEPTHAENTQNTNGETQELNHIYTAVQVQPEPPGGMAAFRKWISENLQYPKEAIDAALKGTVELTFVVERDGSLTDIQVKRDLGYGTGQAGIDLFKKSRKWSPGIQNGRPVRVQFSYPIRMDLSQ